MCFQSVRDLNEKDAVKVLNRFSACKDIEYLYLFYALYRKKHVKEWGKFNFTYFHKMLKNAINENKNDLALKILWGINSTVRDDKEILPEILPFIKLYKLGIHANPKFISAGFHLSMSVSELDRDDAVNEACSILLQFLKLDALYIKSLKSPSEYQHYDYPHNDIYSKIYQHSPDIFYDVLGKIIENISKTKIYLDFTKIEIILFNESNRNFQKKIKTLLAELVNIRPEFYDIHKRWQEKFK